MESGNLSSMEMTEEMVVEKDQVVELELRRLLN